MAAKPDVEVGTGAVRRPSRSWQWLAEAGVVLLLASGTGYLYFSSLIGKNPAKVQMKLDVELKAQGLDDIFVEIGKDWVATVSGFVDNEADKGRALAIVKSDKNVKDIEDRITLVSAEGGSAKTVTEHPSAQPQEQDHKEGKERAPMNTVTEPPSAQPPSMKKVEELIKQGAFE